MSRRFPTRRLATVAARVAPTESVAQFRIALDSVASWSGELDTTESTFTPGTGSEFKPGDVLFGKLRPYLAKVWVADRSGVFYGDFINIRPRGAFDSNFLGYSLRTPYFIDAATALSIGSKMPRTEWQSLREITIAAPPELTQRAIVDYLDHETAEIDALIANQLDALRLLSRRWESELVRIVQTGAGNEIRATGVDTWPQAPTTWRQTRLKATIISARNGAWGTEPGTGEVTARCIRVADFDKIHGSIHDMNTTSRSYPEAIVSESSLQLGDLIIEKSGGGPTTPVGNVVRYTGPGDEMYSNFVARIKVAHGVHSAYALRLHQALYASGVTTRSIKQTTGIQNLDSTSYFNEPIFLPPRAEQQRIAEHLEGRRHDIDELVARVVS